MIRLGGIFLVFFALLYLYRGDHQQSFLASTAQQKEEAALLYELGAHLRELNKAHVDLEKDAAELGLNIGNAHLTDYHDILKYAASSALTVQTGRWELRGTRHTSGLVDYILDRSYATALTRDFRQRQRTCSETEPVPHVLSTAVANISEMPAEFATWGSVLAPDWTVNVFNDSTMNTWLEKQLVVRKHFGIGAIPPVLEEYRLLPRPVVRSDLFRYLTGYLMGGM